MAGKKISELTALGADFVTTDLFEISSTSGGGFVSRKITARELTTSIGATGFNRKFTKTSASVSDHDGDVVYIGTGSSVAGTLYYFDGTDWIQTNASTGSSAAAKGLLGVALGTDTDVDGMLLRGMVTLDHDPGTTGNVLYISDTSAGDITDVVPNTSGDTIRIVGYCLDSAAAQIWFNPDSTYVELS